MGVVTGVASRRGYTLAPWRALVPGLAAWSGGYLAGLSNAIEVIVLLCCHRNPIANLIVKPVNASSDTCECRYYCKYTCI